MLPRSETSAFQSVLHEHSKRMELVCNAYITSSHTFEDQCHAISYQPLPTLVVTNTLIAMKQSWRLHSNRPSDTQFPDLTQHLLDSAIQMPLRILLSGVRIQKLLHLCHPRIRFRTESQLDLHKGLKARIKVWYAQVNQLGQLGEKLLVQGIVGSLRQLGFSFCAGELGRIFIGLLDEFFDLGTGGIVVEEFVVTLFDA